MNSPMVNLAFFVVIGVLAIIVEAQGFYLDVNVRLSSTVQVCLANPLFISLVHEQP